MFAELSEWFDSFLPDSWWADLFVNGLIAGLSGILVFVPQIMILFGLITILGRYRLYGPDQFSYG